MDDVRIVEAQMCYCPSHTDTITSVAQEGLYLSNNTGFSYDSVLSFFRMCEEAGYPQYYVINSEDKAVGWCDIVPRSITGRKVGYIGLGLRVDYRDRGIGTQLMQHALDHAKEYEDAGLDFLFNVETGNWRQKFVSEDGWDWVMRPPPWDFC